MYQYLMESHLALIGVGSVVLAAVAAMALLRRIVPEPSRQRYISLDGLRGFLALFVLAHHSLYWYGYLTTERWTMPSPFYENLGKSSVVMFFMVSGFLFFGKIHRSSAAPIDWTRLGISRVLRITPLYLASMILVFIVVAVVSHGAIRVPPTSLIKQVLQWATFGIAGHPDINGVRDSWMINSGVQWSLAYEWLFYASLPLISVALSKRVSPLALIASACLALLISRYLHPEPYLLLAFGGGALATFTEARQSACRVLSSPIITPVLLIIIWVLANNFYSPWQPLPLLGLAFVFTAIACGNSFFGLLSHPIIRRLGEVSFGIYLLHGIAIYAALKLTPFSHAASVRHPLIYLLLILLITSLIVIVSSLAYLFIERPFISLTPGLTGWLRKIFSSSPRAGWMQATGSPGRLRRFARLSK